MASNVNNSEVNELNETTAFPTDFQTENQEDMIANLEIMTSLKPRATQLENVKQKMLFVIGEHKKETDYFEDCSRTLQSLKDEKEMHQQAIQNIDRDIKQLERVMQTSLKEKARIKEHAASLYSEYQPLKEEVNITRVTLGMESLPEFEEIEKVVK